MKKQSYNKKMNAVVTDSDAKRLNSFFRQELGFYNSLIDVFESRTRAFPKFIQSLTASQQKLFIEFVANGYSINDILNPDDFPVPLQGLKDEVWRNGNINLNESFKMMLTQIGKDKWVISPETKRLMTKTIIDFFINQASILSNPLNSDLIEIAYKVPPANLCKQDITVKRHAQLPKKSITWKWDNDAQETLIYTPYTTKPIIIKVNLNEFNGWNLMILKQESCKYYDLKDYTPWLVEFKESGKYQLKYHDVGMGKKKRV